ncbi:MAG TPA: OmpH family outer membrane protein [Candidatus Angelobacter sp.]|jgi:outer membrane protein|nr:OmpH family outer membrane protein [Candidatus Angelobacter sp.]
MKKKIIFIFSLFLFSLFCISLARKETKKCLNTEEVCLNTEEIIERITEIDKVKEKLEKIGKYHKNILDQIEEEIQKTMEKFKDQDSVELKVELENLQKRGEVYQRIAFDDLNQKQKALMDPLYKKMENAINRVMEKDKSIIRVIDCSPGKCVLVNRGSDITKNVKKELGI